MSLSICLVTRNEAANLPRVLGSVAGLADEVLLIDTGSTDDTVAVATGLGAKVQQFAWDEDFSAARNFALDQANGEWVLWLNPDEELVPESRPQLAPCLARPDAHAYFVHVLDQLTANQPDHVAETLQPRLFRRTGARYVGRLHPQFAVSLQVLAEQNSRLVFTSNLVLRRHVYLSVLNDSKLRWAARLLERELQDRPGTLHYLIEYGRHLLWLNDPRGHEVLAEAAAQVAALREEARPPTATVGMLLEYLLSVSPEQSRSTLSREDAVVLARRWFAQTPPVLWAMAQHLFQIGDFRGAAEELEQLVRLGRSGAYDKTAGFDPRLMGEPALLNLGVCRIKLGELEKAEHCLAHLLRSPTHKEQAARHFAMVQKLKNERGT
jgi:hypothetical protein